MKKNKLYFIIPVVALIAFGFYYWNFSSQYQAVEDAKAAAVKQAKIVKLREEAIAREAAIKDAVDAQKIRKAEKADQEAQKLTRQADKLEKDVAATKDEISKIETEEKRSQEELVFVKQYTAAAKENQMKLADVLTKIQEADAATARAAAAAAAAAAAKRNS